MSLKIAVAAGGAMLGASVIAGVPSLSRGDVRWLNRVTFGIDTSTVARYQRLGREKFLDEQLHAPAADPDYLASELRGLPITHQTAAERMKATRAEQQRINSLASDDNKQQARTALNQAGNEVVYETMK